MSQFGVFQPVLAVVVMCDIDTRRVALPASGTPEACAFVVGVLPLGVAATADSCEVDGADALRLEPALAPCDVAGAPAVAGAPFEIGAGEEGAALAGVNVPVRCQKAEKPLNGPPTTWLDHCRA